MTPNTNFSFMVEETLSNPSCSNPLHWCQKVKIWLNTLLSLATRACQATPFTTDICGAITTGNTSYNKSKPTESGDLILKRFRGFWSFTLTPQIFLRIPTRAIADFEKGSLQLSHNTTDPKLRINRWMCC